MVSGSYTGGISFFQGQKDGTYAKATKLLTKAGKPLSEEYAQSPCMGDWDGDGDWDMVLGFIRGPVKLYINEGKMQFKEAGTLTAGGKPIEANDGGPCIVDWDGDGLLDLLLGDDSGVRVYCGTKKGSRALTLDASTVGMPNATGASSWEARTADLNAPGLFKPRGPGARMKPFAADWNSDGKLDLLVGDFVSVNKPAPELTDAQKKELAALDKQLQDVNSKQSKSYEKAMKAGLQAIGKKSFTTLTQAESKKYSDAYVKVLNADKVFQKRSKEAGELSQKIAKLRPPPDMTGMVYVYLRM